MDEEVCSVDTKMKTGPCLHTRSPQTIVATRGYPTRRPPLDLQWCIRSTIFVRKVSVLPYYVAWITKVCDPEVSWSETSLLPTGSQSRCPGDRSPSSIRWSNEKKFYNSNIVRDLIKMSTFKTIGGRKWSVDRYLFFMVKSITKPHIDIEVSPWQTTRNPTRHLTTVYGISFPKDSWNLLFGVISVTVQLLSAQFIFCLSPGLFNTI